MHTPFPTTAGAFLWHYIRCRPWLNTGVVLTVMGGASAAVASQYGMKLLVDALSRPEIGRAHV